MMKERNALSFAVEHDFNELVRSVESYLNSLNPSSFPPH